METRFPAIHLPHPHRTAPHPTTAPAAYCELGSVKKNHGGAIHSTPRRISHPIAAPPVARLLITGITHPPEQRYPQPGSARWSELVPEACLYFSSSAVMNFSAVYAGEGVEMGWRWRWRGPAQQYEISHIYARPAAALGWWEPGLRRISVRSVVGCGEA